MLLTTWMIAACSQPGQNAQSTNAETTTDSIVEKTQCGDYKLSIATPHTGNALLDNAVMEYVCEQLGGDYMGELTDTKAMLRAAMDSVKAEFDAMGAEMELDSTSEMRLAHNVTGKVLCETDKFLTYELATDEYMGGAHGAFTQTAQTFRKSDGRRLGWDVVKGWGTPEMNTLVKDGLKKYFDVQTDEQLRSNLLTDIDLLPCPVTPPIFGPDGITVRYQQYEIAPYSAGLPECTIPYAQLKSLMSPRLYKEIVE